MNENIDLTKILKDCPKGWIFYSSIFGEVHFSEIEEFVIYPIRLVSSIGSLLTTTKEGKHYTDYDGECTLFPSKDQRDWSKFSAPWYKKYMFDPKTLKPFDKVLVRDCKQEFWRGTLFSSMVQRDEYKYLCSNDYWKCCVPYNDDTKNLIGTKEEAPEYYKTWED